METIKTNEEIEAGLQASNQKLNQKNKCVYCDKWFNMGLFEWLEHYKREHPQIYKEIMKNDKH